jgi:hypothetical protein
MSTIPDAGCPSRLNMEKKNPCDARATYAYAEARRDVPSRDRSHETVTHRVQPPIPSWDANCFDVLSPVPEKRVG